MPTLYPLLMGREVMLASEHYLSASAGARIFAYGGNAIDAAVAATFVEGVVNPHMHTIGGEAPMLIHWAPARRAVAINGNMMAPGARDHRALSSRSALKAFPRWPARRGSTGRLRCACLARSRNSAPCRWPKYSSPRWRSPKTDSRCMPGWPARPQTQRTPPMRRRARPRSLWRVFYRTRRSFAIDGPPARELYLPGGEPPRAR